MGHITILADEIMALLRRQEDLKSDLTTELGHEDWIEYSELSYRETKIKDSIILGGSRAPPPPPEEPALPEHAVSLAASFNSLFTSSSDEAIARYFCEQVIAGLPNRFVLTDNPDDEEDGEQDEGYDRHDWHDDDDYEGGDHLFDEFAPSIEIPMGPNGIDCILEMEMRRSSLGDFSADGEGSSDDHDDGGDDGTGDYDEEHEEGYRKSSTSKAGGLFIAEPAVFASSNSIDSQQ